MGVDEQGPQIVGLDVRTSKRAGTGMLTGLLIAALSAPGVLNPTGYSEECAPPVETSSPASVAISETSSDV